MPETRRSIRIELLAGGRLGELWPPPGRDLVVGPRHTFRDLAAAIDDAFARSVDPRAVLGLVPEKPRPWFGWGVIPDQHGRRWADDDGSTPPPPQPAEADPAPLHGGDLR